MMVAQLNVWPDTSYCSSNAIKHANDRTANVQHKCGDGGFKADDDPNEIVCIGSSP